MGLAKKKPLDYIKQVSNKEFIIYLAAVFLYTNMTGMIGNYRNNYLVDVLHLESTQTSLYNTITSVAGFVLSFFTALYIDTRKDKGNGRFRPLGLAMAIPCGLFIVLSFVSPKGLPSTWLMIYIIVINVLQGQTARFGNVINMVGVVMTPDSKERDNILSFRGISSAIGNSAPLVVVLVAGIFIKDIQVRYVVSAALCGVVGSLSMLAGLKIVKERTVYTQKRVNPLIGMADVLKNKYAWVVLVSEFLKSFRTIANYMGVFLAVALLGDSSKYILLGLPTGIGTFVGMLIINMLLKKFNSKQLYIASNIYSVLANLCAFGIGYVYFANPESTVLNILFLLFLFFIGLQFGASNLLPSMIQADILEDLELKTGKRLDASLPFVIGIGSTISGIIGSTLAPLILYGENSIIKYQPAVEKLIEGKKILVYLPQTHSTKVWLLFFYTVFHGLMMLASGLPFFFYNFTGERKQQVHDAVLEQRVRIAQESGSEYDYAQPDSSETGDSME